MPRLHRNAAKLTDKLEEAKPYGAFSGIARQAEKRSCSVSKHFCGKGWMRTISSIRSWWKTNTITAPITRARLFARMTEADRELLTWAPEALDWHHYWLKVHFPGLNKWVFPKMEEIGQPKAQARLHLPQPDGNVRRDHPAALPIASRCESSATASWKNTPTPMSQELVIAWPRHSSYGDGIGADDRVGLDRRKRARMGPQLLRHPASRRRHASRWIKNCRPTKS